MQKLNSFVAILLLVLTSLCCSEAEDTIVVQNEEQEQEEEQEEVVILSPPSVFEINVTASFNSVGLAWIIEEGDNNEELIFDIYLNDEIVVSNATATAHSLENLAVSTNYLLRITAKNADNETTINSSFDTLDPSDFTFLLETFSYLDTTFTYNYNGFDQLTRRIDPDEFGEDYSYQYNASGQLIGERIQGYDYAYIGNFTYDADILTDTRLLLAEDIYNFEFQNIDNYTVDVQFGVFSDADNFEIHLERVNNKIVSYERIDLDTNELVGKLRFSYQGGNLTRIIDDVHAQDWIIEYDDKNNYGIKLGHFTKPGAGDYFSTSMYFDFIFIPGFIDCSNVNNVTKVYRDGALIVNNTYEYYPYDYPSKIFKNGSSIPRVLTYLIQ